RFDCDWSSDVCSSDLIERVEAGPKGAVVTLRGNRFANPAGLVELIQKNAGTLRLRPDQKLVYLRNWEDEKERLAGVARLMQALRSEERRVGKEGRRGE